MKDDTARHRFEIDMDGQIVFADYRLDVEKLYINHVEAPVALRGTGAAGKLMQAIKNKAQADGLTLVPVCGYATIWLRRNG